MPSDQQPSEPTTSTVAASTHAKAVLRQATWEATQYMTYSEVRQYVNAVLDEVETDEP